MVSLVVSLVVALPPDMLHKIVNDTRVLSNVDKAHAARSCPELRAVVQFRDLDFSGVYGTILPRHRLMHALAGGHCETLDVQDCADDLGEGCPLWNLPPALTAKIRLLRVDYPLDYPELFVRFPSLRRIVVWFNDDPSPPFDPRIAFEDVDIDCTGEHMIAACNHFAAHPPATINLGCVATLPRDPERQAALRRLRVSTVTVDILRDDDDDDDDDEEAKAVAAAVVAEVVTVVAQDTIVCHAREFSMAIAERLPHSVCSLELTTRSGTLAALDRRLQQQATREPIHLCVDIFTDEVEDDDVAPLAAMMARGAISSFECADGSADKWCRALQSAPALTTLKITKYNGLAISPALPALPRLHSLYLDVPQWNCPHVETTLDAVRAWLLRAPSLRTLSISTGTGPANPQFHAFVDVLMADPARPRCLKSLMVTP